jgi:hypothetical protein
LSGLLLGVGDAPPFMAGPEGARVAAALAGPQDDLEREAGLRAERVARLVERDLFLGPGVIAARLVFDLGRQLDRVVGPHLEPDGMLEQAPQLLAQALRGRLAADRPALRVDRLLRLLGEDRVDMLEGDSLGASAAANRAARPPAMMTIFPPGSNSMRAASKPAAFVAFSARVRSDCLKATGAVIR